MQPSDGPFAISGMSENNAPHEQPVFDFLARLIAAPEQHAKFMNMLSMLEHMGSRKIMISQMDKVMTQDTLQHLSEEARHAYFFKRQAERVAKRSLDGWDNDNTMCRIPAAMYFGRMDAGITKTLEARQREEAQKCHSERSEESYEAKGDPSSQAPQDDSKWDSYPWVSLIIELRACWLYHIYQNALDAQDDFQLSLKSLIAEEDHHLAEMFEAAGDDHDLLRELSAYETDLFRKFWAQLEEAFQPQKIAA